MINYYVSRYLNIIPLTDTYLLFNGFNGCIDEISKSLGEYLSKNKAVSISQYISQKEIEFLLKRGHLTKLTDEQELAEFKKYVNILDEHALERYSMQGSLMLLLSYDCNLNCYYCYQKPIRNKKSNKLMTKEFIDNLYDNYIPKLYPNISKADIDISLYGGEPLLRRNREVIERILKYAAEYSNHVGAISNCTEVEYFSDIIGPLPGMINFIQVSIDGDRETHNNSRISYDGAPTFSLILKNIHMMLDKKVNLNIRINIEANSIEKLSYLYDILRKEEILDHPYAYVYVHPLHNHFKQTDGHNFITHEQAANIIEKMDPQGIIRHPIKREADSLAYLMSIEKGVALSKTRFCMQCIPNNYVIDPYGDLYGCYEEVGRDELKIGSLVNGDVIFTPLKEQYLKRSLLNLNKCLGCSVALVCAGECGVQARENNKDIFNPYCNYRKDEILEAIKYVYKKNQSKVYSNSFNLLFPNL